MNKKYKCRVEYLQSDSTAYIDTGVSGANNNLKIEMGFSYSKFTAYGYFFSNYESETANVTRFCLNGTDTSWGLAYINTKSQDGAIYTSNFTKDNFHTFVLTKTSVSIDGSARTNDNPPSGTTNTKNIVLFNRGSGTYYEKRDVGMRCYYFRIYDNGTLVRDFIPVLDNSGRPAMYDQVSGQLFYNKGTGEFTYGRQIIPVEYLESTETQWIDTNIPMENISKIECVIDWTNHHTTRRDIAGGGASGSYSFEVSADGYYGLGYNNWSNVQPSPKDKLTWSWGGDGERPKLYINDALVCTDTLIRVPSGTFKTAISSAYVPYCKFYSIKIYNFDNVLVRDYIPCIDENRVPFMFDLITNTCYLNAGTGQFKVGPNAEKVWGGKKLRRKLGLALANLKKKRKYYCEVEYLEGTGTQWIDTGFIPTENTRTIAGLFTTSTANKNWFGSSATQSPKGCYCFNSFSATQIEYLFGNTVWKRADADAVNKVFTVDFSKNGIYIDDELVATPSYTDFGTGDRTMTLFVGNGGTAYISGRIYYLKMYDNGVLIRDFIPVLDWNMKPCMYDRVTEQLFYNKATSGNDFSYGREIHYVDYLESTGVEYIDTGIKFDGANTKIELKTYEDSLTRRHSICGDDGNFFYYFRGTGNWAVGYNGTAANIDLYMSVGDNVFVMDKNNVYVNGVLAKTYTASSSVSAYNALLFNRKTSLVDNGAVTMYYCKIWNNNILVRDYIPAIDENGVGYMLDRVSHTIYDNVGTGAFGYSGREVEYLESDGARAILAGVTVDDTCGYDVKWMALNANDRIIMGTKGSGESRWVLSGSNNPNVNLSWNTSYGSNGLGLNKIQTAQMNYLNDRKRILNDTPLEDITTTLSANASTYNVGIFAGYWGATTISLYSTCRIYYAKITKGTELIRDFIPMVKNGSPCLYDKVEGEYYYGIGTGTFTRGKIVEPEYE